MSDKRSETLLFILEKRVTDQKREKVLPIISQNHLPEFGRN
jgi:hypothetical protein